MACGVALEDVSAAEEPAERGGLRDAEEPSVALASPTLDERRTVTVLFADLSGYTAVAARLDPESVKRQLERILGRLGEEVVAYGGYVDKFIGDNVMAIFGAPVAHGDDAERAVRAGLGMQGAMDELNEPLRRAARRHVRAVRGHQHRRGARRSRRRQLHGDRRHRQRRRAAAGGGASRAASPSARRPTARPARRSTTARSRAAGAQGQDRAGARVGGACGRRSGRRRPPRRLRADTPLVGRASELAQLHDLLARVQRKRGPHLATVIGDPGVGKSRLLRQFEQELQSREPAAADAPRALPAVRVEHRLLAARRGDSRRVRDHRRRSARGGVGEAVRAPR